MRYSDTVNTIFPEISEVWQIPMSIIETLAAQRFAEYTDNTARQSIKFLFIAEYPLNENDYIYSNAIWPNINQV
ncbi:MAG TPA: hypothetical protein VKK79_25275 [Candidatus Lokiarchaeia archaeon]|nr:hypothetical protein [Candidatus Lokiarchaeia archaeon]